MCSAIFDVFCECGNLINFTVDFVRNHNIFKASEASLWLPEMREIHVHRCGVAPS